MLRNPARAPIRTAYGSPRTRRPTIVSEPTISDTVIFVAPRDEGYAKVLSNMKEVNARGGQIIALTTEGNSELRANKLAAHQLHVPDCPPLMMPIVASVPLQLLAYHIAVLRGCNVDQPRNLAKSVTVE